MAVQFLPPQEDYSGMYGSLGQLLGLGLGGALGYGINQLGGFGNNQVESLKSFGFNDIEARALSKLPPASQAQIIKEKMRQQEGQRQSDLYGQIVSGNAIPFAGSPMGIPMQQQSEQSPVGVEALGALSRPGQSLLEELERRRDAVLRTNFSPQIKKDAVAALDKQIDTEIKKESIQRKQALEERKFQIAEQRDIDKETKPFFDKITKESREAKKNDMRLNRMEELVRKGNLTGPLLSSVLETASKGIFGLGIDLTGLINADSQEFNKLSKDFLKGAKEIFGSRITDFDAKAFLSTVPSLLQSDEGKMRVINNLRLFNDASAVERQALEQIIEENNGRRPRNLESLVEKRSKEILDNLADQFKKGIRGRTPEEKVPQITGFKPEELIGPIRRLPPFVSAF